MKQTEIGLMPDDWELVSLGSINTYKNKSINPYEYKKELFEYYSIPAYQTGEKPTETLGSEIESNKLILENGMILFGKLNPRVEKVWYVNSKSELRKIGSTEWIPVLPTNKIDKTFLYFAEWGPYIMPLAKTKVTGSTPSRQRVDPTSFYQIKFPLPSLAEQRTISQILSLIKEAIEKQEEIISTTTELKNALRQKLFNEGIKNEKQKETEIGLVPKSWKIVELSKTGDVIYGIQAAVANNLKPIGTRILTNINITLDGNFDLEKIRYYKLKSKRDFNTTLQQGDILFNWRSGSKEHVGKTVLFDLEGEWTHSSFILRIRPNEKIDNYYLYLYLNHLRATGYFVKKQTYSINAKFNKSAIEVLPVALPSLEEQKIISTAIKSVNAKLDHHNLKKETLTNLFKTMLHQLMTGEIRVNNLQLHKEYKITEPKLSIAAEE